MSGAGGYLAELCRLYVFAALAVAAVAKARRLRAFAATLGELLYLPPSRSAVAAVLVVAGEGAAAVLLLAGGRWTMAGMIAALLLFSAFAAAIGVALARGRTVHCSCFGGRGEPMSGVDLVRNALLMVACLGWLLGPAGVPLPTAASAVVAAVALVPLVITVRLHDLVWLVR